MLLIYNFSIYLFRNNLELFNIYIIYMPSQIKMFLSNGNLRPIQSRTVNTSNLSSGPVAQRTYTGEPKAANPPSALSAPIISRIHSIRPGCGSCGRH